MIHIQAVGVGLVILAIGAVISLLVAVYPAIGLSAVGFMAAYCIGRGVLGIFPRNRS